MLYLIGLGLGDETDITLKGLNIIMKCSRVYLESYTSILGIPHERLEELYGKKVILADREMVESEAEGILRGADKEDIAFLVVGDPFGATTHTDLTLRARDQGIQTRTIHNASIINAVSSCGLQLYNFGQVVSVPFFTENWRPSSFYPRIKENLDLGLHTLVLLDIKVKEQSLENLARNRKIYEPPRYMTIPQACSQLLEIESQEQQGVCTPTTLAVGLARVGAEDEKIVVGTLEELRGVEFGAPLHSLIVVGGRGVHEVEIEFLRGFLVGGSRALEGLEEGRKG